MTRIGVVLTCSLLGLVLCTCGRVSPQPRRELGPRVTPSSGSDFVGTYYRSNSSAQGTITISGDGSIERDISMKRITRNEHWRGTWRLDTDHLQAEWTMVKGPEQAVGAHEEFTVFLHRNGIDKVTVSPWKGIRAPFFRVP